MYPIAFAVVDNESDESWGWFVEHLHHVLHGDSRVITFISDRNVGLLNAASEWFPDSPHAYCYYHIKINIQAKLPGDGNKEIRERVLKLFARCAYTYSKKAFHKAYNEMINEGGDVIAALFRTCPFVHWANSYFPVNRYGEMSSNLIECFNSWILNERPLPITQLVDGICARMMEMIGRRSFEAKSWTSYLCPKMEKLLQSHVKAGKHWIVNRSNDEVFEVLGDFKVRVDLGPRLCTCGSWRLLGFPCVHAVTIMKFIGENPYEYVDEYFTAEKFRDLYSFPIYPIIQHVDNLPDDEGIPFLLPPTTKTQPGRPKTNRFKNKGEIGKIKCGRCGEIGSHNRRTCSAII